MGLLACSPWVGDHLPQHPAPGRQLEPGIRVHSAPPLAACSLPTGELEEQGTQTPARFKCFAGSTCSGASSWSHLSREESQPGGQHR